MAASASATAAGSGAMVPIKRGAMFHLIHCFPYLSEKGSITHDSGASNVVTEVEDTGKGSYALYSNLDQRVNRMCIFARLTQPNFNMY